jgi:hypothetical protein
MLLHSPRVPRYIGSNSIVLRIASHFIFSRVWLRCSTRRHVHKRPPRAYAPSTVSFHAGTVTREEPSPSSHPLPLLRRPSKWPKGCRHPSLLSYLPTFHCQRAVPHPTHHQEEGVEKNGKSGKENFERCSSLEF